MDANGALLTVRLAMRAVLEREQSSLQESPLAADPQQTVATARGFLFVYPTVVYGYISDGDDGRHDLVYEDLLGVFAGRAFDITGRPIDLEKLRALVARIG